MPGHYRAVAGSAVADDHRAHNWNVSTQLGVGYPNRWVSRLSRRPDRRFLALVLLLITGPLATSAGAQVTETLDEAVPAGANFARAEFRLWYPKDADRLRGVVVLVPGSNGDGRSQVDDSVWRAFAGRHGLALLGCYFTDKPHEQAFIEEYVRVSEGTGQALLDALDALGRRSGRTELATAPLLLWGMSAGGQFNYELVGWRPDRVLAFVVNKGGIYYSALLSSAAREVPGLFFVGERDIAFRNQTIEGLFAVNRRGGALWALVEEPGIEHEVGRSRELATIFFEEVLALRLPVGGSGGSVDRMPRRLSESTGWVGDLQAKNFRRSSGVVPGVPTAWLATERVARAWLAVVTGRAIVEGQRDGRTEGRRTGRRLVPRCH